ncbi:MAG: hypothetical protein CME25_15390 [Gemmatimonadetes bacterium]|nr:hypothetical protein [Gemmatimonadota bacterium]|tara:strand:+ start:2127 stop:2495 length:369 start_codon:yes stop_codon:yes gene_type:complete
MTGEAGRTSLLELSDDEDEQVRRWAMLGLIDLGGASDVCLMRLGDSDIEVRRLASQGLQRSPLKEDGPAIVLANRDSDSGLRLAAVRALAVNPHRISGDALIAALQDEESSVRRAVFYGVVT